MDNVSRHPEWKRLYDGILPMLEVGRVFEYESLRELLGIDPRTGRGYNQFQRCAKEIARNLSMQFECVKRVGYRVVPSTENTSRMHNRMGRAKRRLRDAAFIGLHTKLDELTSAQRAANADILARVGRLAEAITDQGRKVQAVIERAEPVRLPHPAREVAVKEAVH